MLVDLAERVARLSQPRFVGALGIVEPATGGLEGRVSRLLQECNTMTRMNLSALLATALFGLAVGTLTLVINVRAAYQGPSKSPTVEGLGGANDSWPTAGIAAKEFSEPTVGGKFVAAMHPFPGLGRLLYGVLLA